MKISPQINKILTRMIKLVILLFSMYGMVEDSSDHYFKGDTTILTDYKQLLVDIREMKMPPEQARDSFRVVLSPTDVLIDVSTNSSRFFINKLILEGLKKSFRLRPPTLLGQLC